MTGGSRPRGPGFHLAGCSLALGGAVASRWASGVVIFGGGVAVRVTVAQELAFDKTGGVSGRGDPSLSVDEGEEDTSRFACPLLLPLE
jgi:hypothetical protein